MKKHVTGMITIIIMLMVALPLDSAANPIPRPVDGGNVVTPFSLNDPLTVEFMEEKITFVFSGLEASVNAKYVFTNIADDKVTLTIILPFSNKPDDLNLLVSSAEIDFDEISGVSFTFDGYNYSGYSAISFDLVFNPMEAKTIEVAYRRSYSYTITDSSIMHSFAYIVGTAKYWKNPLSNATFEYWIPESTLNKMFLHDNQSWRIEGNKRVILETYSDWMPDDFTIGIRWVTDKPLHMLSTVQQILASIIFTIPIILIISFAVFLKIRQSRNKASSK